MKTVPRATDVAYAALRQMILSGDMSAGSHLGEVELAATLGLSRTPVREALQRLDSEGLVEVLPHRGARVVRWTPEALEEIFELRALLEPYGAGRAAGRGVPEPILGELDALCDAMERAAADRDFPRVAELNASLHGLVLETSGNTRLTGLVRTVVHVPIVIGTFERYDAAALARSMNHHRELVTALRARDPEWASSVMRSHVRAAADFLIDHVRQDHRHASGAEPQ
jgi:DNA-binding GntR family transcriptional regulator